MDLRQLEDIIKEPEEGKNKKDTLISESIDNKPGLDSASALQLFLDRIPITAIPGIQNSPVLEVNAGDSVRDTVQLLYEKNVSGAPIADLLDPDTTTAKFWDRYIGFIDFATVILWSLQQSEKARMQTRGNEMGKNVIFTMLEQNPRTGQTKIGELAKSFLRDPFFPVGLDDALFQVLLLHSKHRLCFQC